MVYGCPWGIRGEVCSSARLAGYSVDRGSQLSEPVEYDGTIIGLCSSPVDVWSGLKGLSQNVFDPAFGRVVLPVEALRVDPQQDVDAVPGPLGHLGRRDPCIEPR